MRRRGPQSVACGRASAASLAAAVRRSVQSAAMAEKKKEPSREKLEKLKAKIRNLKPTTSAKRFKALVSFIGPPPDSASYLLFVGRADAIGGSHILADSLQRLLMLRNAAFLCPRSRKSLSHCSSRFSKPTR